MQQGVERQQKLSCACYRMEHGRSASRVVLYVIDGSSS